MKKFYFSLIVIFLSLLQQSTAQCSSCTFTYGSSSSSDMSFTAGTYCFVGGTYTGNINNMAAGTTICVGPGAIFKPQNVNGSLAGNIKVYGECQLPTFNVATGFKLENYNKMTFSGNLNFNGSNAKIYNYADATMLFVASFQLGNGGSIENNGNMRFNGNFNTTSGTTVYNGGSIRLTDNFNPAGKMLNQGLVVAQNVININSGAEITNNCKFVSVKGFQNNGYLINNGLVWVTSSNEGESHIQNNGGATIETGSKSVLRGMQFTNNGVVKGSGKFYFTTTTRQQGSFNGTSSGAPITFYDVTQSVGLIFDFPQQNQVYTNTVRTNFTPADTTTFDCSTTILPVQLSGFDAQAVQNRTVLVSWQSRTEVNLKKFVIERSSTANSTNWETAGTINAAGNSASTRNYQFTDSKPLSGISYYRLRSVDVDGKETISAIRQVNIDGKAASLQVYPTLVQKGGFIKIITTEPVRYQLLDVSGKTIMTGTFVSGANTLSLNVNTGNYIIETLGANNVRQHSKLIVQ